ncbi:MAG: cytochrome P450, partial [Actinomycetota bacterium]|nr:cytochrome P450 [Actinomycetota bacterium]
FAIWALDLARNMDNFYKGRDDAMRARLADYDAYVKQLVAGRRRNPGDDMVSELLRVDHGGDQLTDTEVQVLCNTLIFAGHETTVNLLSNAVNALLDHPEQFDRLAADPDLTATAVEEFLRFDSPAQMISRTALEDFRWHGSDIEAGDSVLAVVSAAHRDDERFVDPDQLDVGRAPNPHLAFGAGIHFCPGAQLTRLEARAALPRVLERLPTLRRDDAAAAVRRPTAVLRGFEHLPVRI